MEILKDEELVKFVVIENPEGIWNPIEAVGCPQQECYSAWS